MGHAGTIRRSREEATSLIRPGNFQTRRRSNPSGPRIGPRWRCSIMTNSRYVPALLLVASLVPTGRALALERAGYSMEILVGGTPLSQYAARETTYVEALKNRDYSVRLRNGTGERVAIALSVDGLNSIDARTTSASEARKWVLGPYETVTLDGWQTSSATARRFFFTSEERSYGSWLGRTKNLGIIAAVVFRERRPQPVIAWPEAVPQRERQEKDSGGSEAPAPSAGKNGVLPAPTDDMAATGIGT